MHTRIPPSAVVVLLAACAGDVADTRESELPELAAVEALRVGSPDDPEQVFTAFSALRVSADGRVVTLHPQEHRLLVHDGAGRRLASFGREGEGPGEFKNAFRMGLVADTVWILDYAGYRFDYFDLEGEWLRSVRVPIDLGRGLEVRPPRPERLLSDGTIVGAPPAFSRGIASGDITEEVLVTMTPDGEVVDTLARYSLVNTVLEMKVDGDTRGRRSYGAQPFNDSELFEISPSDLSMVRVTRAVGNDGSSGVTVTRTTVDGHTVFVQSGLPVETVPVTEADVETFVGSWAERAAESFYSDIPEARLRDAITENLYNPGFRAPVSRLVLGHDGSVWLKGPLHRDSEDVEWTVLDRGGSPVGRVALPKLFRLLDARRDQVWGLERDDLDVPYIVSYEVQRSDGSTARDDAR